MDVQRLVSLLLPLLVLLATTFAQERCCFPGNQYENYARQLIIANEPSRAPFTLLIDNHEAKDFNNNRSAQVMVVNKYGRITNQRVVFLFNEGAEYLIFEDEKFCDKVRVPGTGDADCVPESARYLGPYDMSGLAVDGFELYEESLGDVYGITTFFVTKDCIPVGTQWIGVKHGVSQVDTRQYFNYSSVIKDPDWYFNIPPYCPEKFNDNPAPIDYGPGPTVPTETCGIGPLNSMRTLGKMMLIIFALYIPMIN